MTGMPKRSARATALAAVLALSAVLSAAAAGASDGSLDVGRDLSALKVSGGDLYMGRELKSLIDSAFSQADAMKEAGVPIEAVVDIDVPDEEIIKRMSGRRVHLASGRTYHVVFNPPREEGKDDETGEPLIQRDDDKEETVRKRLDVYHAQTEPLVGYYKDWEESGESAAPKYIRIDGVGKVDEIRDQIFTALDDLK